MPAMKVIEELGRLDDARFLAMYESLVQNGFGPLDGEVARSLKFRPQAIRKLPLAQRAKRARSLLARSSDLTYELFGGYLMRHHKELVTGFLDKTGVEHEDGMLQDLSVARPDPAKIAPAVKELDESFPPEEVTLYLSMCADQWSDVEELETIWRERAGVPAS